MYIRDQTSERVPDSNRIVQRGQRIQAFGDDLVLAPAPFPAELRGFGRISMKKA
jgi:hypothetical protein